jgi:filamentous hemagglutinin family protein
MTQSWNCWRWQLGLASFLALFGASSYLGDCARAQSNIKPDNNLGQESSLVQQNANGTSDEVIYGGAQRGANLFHSFQEFNVSEGRRALFYSPSADIQNILARVTGGNPSKIMGVLGTYTDSGESQANLFLINPNGILFGPNASLNVGGSFVASTASSVNFADGTSFSATAPQTTPLLTVSVPIGLQFGGTAGSIINQSHTTNSSGELVVGLQIQPGKTLALLGGDVALEGGSLTAAGDLTAAGGRIELGSVAGNSLVRLNQTDKGWSLGYEGVHNFQDIQLSQQAVVDASGKGGGDIQVQGRRIALTDTSSISADTLGSQDGGKISIQSSEFIAQDGSIVSAKTFDKGQGGTLSVTASNSVKLSGSSVDGPSGLFSQTEEDSTGASGNLTIATRQLQVLDGAQVATTIFGAGQGGNLSVTAESIKLSGTGILADREIASGLFSQTEEDSTGASGNLTIATRQLQVLDGAQVSAAALGNGQAGTLKVTASDFVELSGTSVNGNIFSGLFTQNQGISAAGDLTVVTGQLNVRNRALVSVSGQGSGNAGNLDVAARSITLDNQATLTATSDKGRGGNIKLQARDLLLTRNGSRISATSFGSGDEGNINIDTSVLVALENSNITASAAGLGANIRINTQGLFFSPDSKVTASGSTTIEGTVEVGNPNVLPQEVVNVAGLITQGCSASGGQAANRFIVTGRGGLPPTPRETLSSDTVLEDWGTLALAPTESLSTEQRDVIENRFGGSAVSSHPTAPESAGPIVEAQGWMIGANGQVVLTAQAPNVTPHNPWQTPSDCHRA